MHPEVTSDEPGRCPKCGMKLLAGAADGQAGMDHGPGMHHGGHDAARPARPRRRLDDHAGHDAPIPRFRPAAGIEWEDDMVAVNRQTTAATMHWMFVDRTAGAGRRRRSTGGSRSATG